MCDIEGSNQKGRPLGRWRDRVKEYRSTGGVIVEKVGLNGQGGIVWTVRGGGFSVVAIL